MTLTAMFKKYTTTQVIGPRGGLKWEHGVTEVEDTLHPVTVKFDVEKIFYVRGSELNKERQNLYNADGTFAKGIWQHGRYGSKMHKESIEVWKGTLVTRSSYASGQIKDQHKYLKSINC